MKATSNEIRRNRIISAHYTLLSDATVIDYPGKNIKVLTSSWTEIKYSSINFSEALAANGNFVEQELELLMFGSSSEIMDHVHQLIGNEVLIKFTYSNNEVKIFGTEENPVLLLHSSSGSPVQQRLYTKHFSAEYSKYLIN